MKLMFVSPASVFRLVVVAGLLGCATAVIAGTITVQTNVLGPTPEIIAYNFSHFNPGSNTRGWWRYTGVSGIYYVQAANLTGGNWMTIRTKAADANGHGVFTGTTTNFPARFYRILTQ